MGRLRQEAVRRTKAILAYLSRHTHRVAISNSRLIRLDDDGVTFKWKDYRVEGRDRFKTMTLAAHEFIRRFLLHVLPSGFHRIRNAALRTDESDPLLAGVSASIASTICDQSTAA